MKKRVLDYLMIVTGAFFLGFSINFFLVPLKISTGGLSGVGMILYHFFRIPISVTVLIFNAFLFFFGIRTLPKDAIPKSIAGILFLSLFLELTKNFILHDVDWVISSVFGGILCGVGVGLVILRGGSTGGSDFAALILNRIFPHVSIAYYILVIDTVVILLSGILFRNLSVMFYSVISLYISSKVADFLLV
ncbi:MAG: YitT family protein, partial [Clostridia bacterium]|nr:YitT family protein [Clostridia bacterium]